MAAPATVPATGSIVAPAAGAPLSPSVLQALTGRLKEYGSNVLKQQKPWSEIFDRTTLSMPPNVSEGLSRIRKNTAYFKVNYLLVMLTTCAVTLVMNPSSLLVLALLMAAWLYMLFIRTQPVVLWGRQLSDREKVLGMAGVSFITIFFLTSVGTVFFTALSFSLALILGHGYFREPDNLFLDDQETQPMLFGILPSVPAATTGLQAV